MMPDFYKRFEDEHRGDRDLILKRLAVYLPFVLPLKNIYDAPVAIDLGCGRGEWLELLSKYGFISRGYDIDKHMVDSCNSRSLNASCADAIEALESIPDSSVAVVSAFHVVEHIDFASLQKLISNSLRVLRDGGLLILETPNPENIFVSTLDFYIDPTHKRPLPPMLLEFAVKYAGFEISKVIRLNESDSLAQNLQSVNLLDVLGGASPNYAVIAQKGAPKQILEHFVEPFSKEYGFATQQLATLYDSKIEAKFFTLKADLDSKIEATNEMLNSILNSRSWRYTAWLRGIAAFFRSLQKPN